MTTTHSNQAPSDWVRQWAHLVPERPGGARVLDLACGHGRHSRWLARQGHWVTAVDRDEAALATLADMAPGVRTLQADIENQPWPLSGRQFDAVVVTHYLWRPLLPDLLASIAPSGLLLYETFSRNQATIGRPSRPDFLLEAGELLRLCGLGWHVVAYEDGFLEQPERFVQRIAAIRQPEAATDDNGSGQSPLNAPRHLLRPAG